MTGEGGTGNVTCVFREGGGGVLGLLGILRGLDGVGGSGRHEGWSQKVKGY